MPEPRDDQEESFTAAYDRYAPKMYRIAISMGVPAADAVEIVQGIFMGYLMHAYEVENLPGYLLGSIRGASARYLAPPDDEAPSC